MPCLKIIGSFENKTYMIKILFRIMLLSGLVLVVERGFAQQIKQSPANDPAITWLPSVQAQTQLRDKLDMLHPQLQALTPGTAPYTDLLRRIIFYKSILRGVVKEIPLPVAIEHALPDAASMGGIYEQAFTPEPVLRLLYDEAVDLLADN